MAIFETKAGTIGSSWLAAKAIGINCIFYFCYPIILSLLKAKIKPAKLKKMIKGVQIFEIQKNADDRGFLSETWRKSQLENFSPKQMNFTIAHPGVIKAFHFHKNQSDLWFCTSGNLEAVLYDQRKDSSTFGEIQKIALGEFSSKALLIPPGVAHGYRVLGEKAAGLVYLVDQEYNSANPDEGRIAHDDPEIGFDWSTQAR
jgi:dTDP-4-dehydrorhamnose 3,5-epimerase